VRPARLLLGLLLVSCACRRGPAELTYFDGAHAVSVRHPADWRSLTPPKEGGAIRCFASPEGSPAARACLAADGVRVDADERGQQAHRAALAAIAASFTRERPGDYPERREPEAALRLRIPPSWREVRRIRSGERHVLVFTSPALALAGGATVHASLMLTAEPVGPGGLPAYYRRASDGLGPGFRLVTHHETADGYVDEMVVDTSVSTARSRRFYRAAGGRAAVLAFEAPDDVYWDVAPWFDVIASTLVFTP
jgi:hypothetical protein